MGKKRFFGACGFIVGMLSYGNLALAQADTVFTNGRYIRSTAGTPMRKPWPSRTGSSSAWVSAKDIKKFIGKQTRVVDLGGAFAMPGLSTPTSTRRSRTCRKRAALCCFPRVSARSKSRKHSRRT